MIERRTRAERRRRATRNPPPPAPLAPQSPRRHRLPPWDAAPRAGHGEKKGRGGEARGVGQGRRLRPSLPAGTGRLRRFTARGSDFAGAPSLAVAPGGRYCRRFVLGVGWGPRSRSVRVGRLVHSQPSAPVREGPPHRGHARGGRRAKGPTRGRGGRRVGGGGAGSRSERTKRCLRRPSISETHARPRAALLRVPPLGAPSPVSPFPTSTGPLGAARRVAPSLSAGPGSLPRRTKG